MHIPVREVKERAASATGVGDAEALSVLVVDDLADVREALRAMAQRLGHECKAVGSASEARALLAARHFDAVLIDLEMPGTDGRSLAIGIREGAGPNAATMLLLVSAADNQPTGQAWPFDGFVQKPVDELGLERLFGAREQA